jgi:hypothetical protein
MKRNMRSNFWHSAAYPGDRFLSEKIIRSLIRLTPFHPLSRFIFVFKTDFISFLR